MRKKGILAAVATATALVMCGCGSTGSGSAALNSAANELNSALDQVVQAAQSAVQETKPETPAETPAEKPAETPSAPSGATKSQEQAIKSAKRYLEFSAFSRQGLIDQLSSEYGEQFPIEDATYAVDYLESTGQVDWNEQAAKSAAKYLDFSSFSRQGLIDQLSSEYGEKFTVEQAEYGANAVGL